MATKLNTDGARDQFRPKFVVNAVARIKRDNVNYSYKGVIFTYEKIPNNVPDHEALGYEIVYSTDHIDDDRKFGPGTTAEGESLRPAPVVWTSKDGYQHVLMQILKTKQKENKLKKAKQADSTYRNSTKRKVSAEGSNVTIEDGEINLNNINGENRDE